MDIQYSYRSKDYSIITPIFKKYCVRPLMPLVPKWVPANLITIISSLFLYLALFLSFDWWLGNSFFKLFLVSLLVFAYAVGDHIDGMQARRSSTSSPLGEFCDHYLDVFNNGIIIMILIFIFQVKAPVIIIALLLTSYLAHVGVIYEQFHTGWLVFEKIGSLEAVLLTALLALFALNDGFYALTQKVLFLHYTVFESFLSLSILGALGTFLKSLMRTKKISWQAVNFFVSLLLVSLVSFYSESNFYIFLLIAFYSAEYSVKLMRGHLIDGKERYPDRIVPLVAAVIFILINLKLNVVADVFLFLTIYLLFLITYNVCCVFHSLKKFWVWKNAN